MNEPVFVENGVCPHCGASPTVQRNDLLQALCLGCMQGSCEVVNAVLTASRLAKVFRQAVPMEIFKLQELSEEQFRVARQEIVERAEVQAAIELSVLVRGMAVLAFLPGGVPLFGLRWTARRPPSPPVARGRLR